MRQMTAILEGEGGILWVLVLLALLVALLLRGGSCDASGYFFGSWEFGSPGGDITDSHLVDDVSQPSLALVPVCSGAAIRRGVYAGRGQLAIGFGG